MGETFSLRQFGWIKAALYAVLLVGIYYSALSWLIIKDWPRDDYSYCYLIPFVVLYLIWEKKKELLRLPSVPSWYGVIPVGLGIMLFWLGELGGEMFSLYLSLWLTVIGLTWLHFGWRKMKTIGFALVIAVTMFPLPHFVYKNLSLKLKLISSQLGVAMMQCYGLSAYREGNIIDLGFTQLQVVDACSGLRYFIPLIILSLLLAYFFKAAFWKRALLVISSVPLSIITNSLRIALTGILYEAWGPAVAEGFFHGFSGWFIFVFSLGVLLLEMWVLSKVPSSRFKVQDKDKTEVDSSGFTVRGRSNDELLPQSGFRIIQPPQFIVATALLALTLAVSYGVEFREKIPVNTPLNKFPLSIGEWVGAREIMEEKFVESLDLSDYVIIDYRDGTGKAVNFYVAYYESQRKGESIHSPASCLPGSGWVFQEAGQKQIVLSENQYRAMTVNRAFMKKSGYNQLVYFWFPQRGRILTDAYQLKLYAFWDALTKQRTDGALVRLVTTVYESEDLADAEARLEGFVRQVVPVLEEFIPGSEINVRD